MRTSALRHRPERQFGLALAIAMSVCVGLYVYGQSLGPDLRFTYLPWNLFLSAIPLVFAVLLHRSLRRKRWSDWSPLGWSLLWLLFLPNSFYMISDFIHLAKVPEADVLYAAVLFTSFIYVGVLLGFASMYIVHRQLLQRLGSRVSAAWMGVVLLLCSMAIYLGRDLRWNSWDVVFQPAGLLFDVSERLLHPANYPSMFVTILSFFALLTSLYAVVWAGSNLVRHYKEQ